MGLNPRGRGQNRGNKANFQGKGRRGGGMVGQGPMFIPGPPGAFCPPGPLGFPSRPPFGSPRFFPGPSGYHVGPPRPPFNRFPRKNFKKNTIFRKNDTPVPEIDLTKPWVTEEIKNEENKKQELLQIWRKTKSDEDWSKYKAQKLSLQCLYDKAKAEYAKSHPNEAVLWENISTVRQYYCETCDKSFRTDDDFILHESEHEVCGREGCEFSAHPKIIAKHIKMQHITGLYKRIGKLSGEEEIAKWIEERKKRYPTRKVVEEKKILEEKKLNRGEKIKENNSKFNKSFMNKDKSSGKKNFDKKTSKRNKNRVKRKKIKNISIVEKCLEEESPAFRTGVPAFLGIKNGEKPEVIENENLNISDDEWDTEIKSPAVKKPVLNSSLGLLATFYDSNEENENEKPTAVARVDDMSDREGSDPEEVKTVTSKNLLPEEKPTEKKFSRKRKFSEEKDFRERKRKNFENDVEQRSLTLLEKLLKNEIRHERNVILQCVHYVVKNNFFQT